MQHTTPLCVNIQRVLCGGSEIALEGWVLPLRARPRFGASFAKAGASSSYDPFVQANLLHTLQPSPRPCPPLLSQFFGFLILDKPSFVKADPRELSNRSPCEPQLLPRTTTLNCLFVAVEFCSRAAQLYLLPIVSALLVLVSARCDWTTTRPFCPRNAPLSPLTQEAEAI